MFNSKSRRKNSKYSNTKICINTNETLTKKIYIVC